MAKNNKKCIVCGTEYSYCPSCQADRKKPFWMTRCDKQECEDIFQVGCDFENGVIDALEASKKLQGYKFDNVVSTSLKETLAKIGLTKKEKETKEEIKEDKKDVKVAEPVKAENEIKEEKKTKKFFE